MRFKKGDIHKDNVGEGSMEECGMEEESAQMRESAPPGFGPGKAHADIYNKIMQQYGSDSPKAYATMWKIYKKMDEVANECMMDECGMEEAGLTSENEAGKEGEGHEDHEAEEVKLIKVVRHIADKLEKMHKGMGIEEGGPQYKVAPKMMAKTQKDNQAYARQGDPKVNETSYKTQGPSLRTFRDSPQLSKATNNPKIA